MTDASHRIVLGANDFAQLKGIPFLRDVIVLSHVMNTIRSSQRFLLMNEEQPNGPTKSRDTVFGLITTLSFVCEGVKTAAGILKQVAASLPEKLHNDIAWVTTEEKDCNSLFNTTLTSIRNQVAFHFNLQVGDDILGLAVQNYPPVFEEGTSSRIVDSAYVLADDVIAQIFAQCVPSDGTPSAKMVHLLEQLSQYSVRLCKILDSVIAHLIADYTEGQLGRNCT